MAHPSSLEQQNFFLILLSSSGIQSCKSSRGKNTHKLDIVQGPQLYYIAAMALIPPGTSLLSASGLLLRSREAVGRCDRLLQKLGQLGRKSSGDIAALHLVDEISKVICAVLEPAAFLAAIAETGSETAQIAQIAHADLARFLAELNARPEPYEALLAVERDVELMGQMDQQDKQMLWDMKAELESNGASKLLRN